MAEAGTNPAGGEPSSSEGDKLLESFMAEVSRTKLHSTDLNSTYAE